MNVIIAAHPKEQDLVGPAREAVTEAGYAVWAERDVLVGESVLAEADRVLGDGAPLVFLATDRACGAKHTRRLLYAARQRGVRTYVVLVEDTADVEALSAGEKYGSVSEVVDALRRHFPLVPSKEAQRARGRVGQYLAKVLDSCDIVDLANLPVEDRHLAMRRILLRQLYAPLRLSDPERPDVVHPLGELLAESPQLLILGDPGAGKSTLLKWMITGILMRERGDPTFDEFPDREQLPLGDLVPVRIRCREFASVPRDLDALLESAALEENFTKSEAVEIANGLRAELEAGRAILLIDGLDEVSDLSERRALCRLLLRLPSAPMIVTSRHVGFRELRLGLKGIRTLHMADLQVDDQHTFARRWAELTEAPDRAAAEAEELVHAIHSSSRVERLARNPMLLTTLALVKRKVRRLPSRRADLYEEATKVLLNWRAEVDEPVDPEEALPQLEFLACSMSIAGKQRLPRALVIETLERARTELSSALNAVRRRPVEEFVNLIERRTGLFVEIGREAVDGVDTGVFEFRHLTFQEYLAGRALAFRHFQGFDSSRPLPAQVAELNLTTSKDIDGNEVFRLAIASMSEHEAGPTILALLGRGGAPALTLAALCLADEPRVDPALALQVVERLFAEAEFVDDLVRSQGHHDAFDAMVGSAIAPHVGERLSRLYKRFSPANRAHVRFTAGRLRAPSGPSHLEPWAAGLPKRLRSQDPFAAEEAVYEVAGWALSFRDRRWRLNLQELLLKARRLAVSRTEAYSWAVMWLSWELPTRETSQFARRTLRGDWASNAVRGFAMRTLAQWNDEKALPLLLRGYAHGKGSPDIIVEAIYRLSARHLVPELLNHRWTHAKDEGADLRKQLLRRELLSSGVHLSAKNTPDPLHEIPNQLLQRVMSAREREIFMRAAEELHLRLEGQSEALRSSRPTLRDFALHWLRDDSDLMSLSTIEELLLQ